MENSYFGTEKINKIIFKIAPPVMLAQLIQALYNIIDSFFVGKYSGSGLTALSIIYPIQLLMIALAVGTGVGINTSMSYSLGVHDEEATNKTAGVGTPIAVFMYVVFSVIAFFTMPLFARMSSQDEAVIMDVIKYGRITTVFSFGLFLESIWTKVLQARGDMKTPMFAQIAGAIVNIVLDPILIFGMIGLPKMGISGAATATVCGQVVAALIVMRKGFMRSPELKCYSKEIKRIYVLGIPNILMQSAYTVYILGLNLILKGFSDDAVTALGIYYKWQTFFFIPLGALQTCIVPIIGYNYSAGNLKRCKDTLNVSLIYGFMLMTIGVLCFELVPRQMIQVFSNKENVIEIGVYGFRFIGVSFIPLVTSLIYPVFFQAVGRAVKSSLLTFFRTIVLFVPLAYIFSRFGLEYFWWTYPITETVTTIIGFIFYVRFIKKETRRFSEQEIIE